jgi:hypothetical protein
MVPVQDKAYRSPVELVANGEQARARHDMALGRHRRAKAPRARDVR